MRRRITLAISTVLALAALVMPLSASAYLGPDPITLSGNWSSTASILSFGADPSSPPASGPGTLHKARMALGTMPSLDGLGDIALGGSGYSVAWRISTSTSGGRLISFPLDVGTSWSGTYISGTKWDLRSGINDSVLAARLGLSTPMTYWQLENTNYLGNPNSGWYFTCPGGYSWNQCQQWSGYAENANNEYLEAIEATAEAVPEATLVEDFYCNSPNTPQRQCTGLILTLDAMESLMGTVANVAYTTQSTTKVTFNFTPASRSFSDPQAADARRKIRRDPPTQQWIGPLVDASWEGLDTQSLLEQYAPRLYYDEFESFHADSVNLITDNYDEDEHEYTNKLILEGDTVAASSDPDGEGEQLEIGFLGAQYPDESTSAYGDRISIAEWGGTTNGKNYGQVVDAQRLHDIPGNGDITYGQVLEGEAGTTILQYWFFYYSNPKEYFDVGEHEGDWEGIQIILDDELVPMVATYSQHTWRESCMWENIETTSDNRPVVYVGDGSHASYFTPGNHDVYSTPYLVQDSADGENAANPVDPSVVDITERPDWVGWAGTWGASPDPPGPIGGSPIGPLYHGQFDAEGAWDYTYDGARACQNPL